MTSVVWSRAAQRDLRAIHDWIARDSKAYASRFVDRIKAKVDRILFPESGSIVPEWDRLDFRETFVSSYRVIYRIRGEGIQVVTVIHGARQLPDQDEILCD